MSTITAGGGCDASSRLRQWRSKQKLGACSIAISETHVVEFLLPPRGTMSNVPHQIVVLSIVACAMHRVCRLLTEETRLFGKLTSHLGPIGY